MSNITYSPSNYKSLKLVFSWIPSDIGIEGNGRADSLAKEALNLGIDQNTTPTLPYSDFRPKVKNTLTLEYRMGREKMKAK